MSNPAPAYNGTPAMVTGFFRNRDLAERALTILARLDYKPKEISLMKTQGVSNLVPPTNANQTRLHPLENRALEGAGLGGALGGTIGAILAGLGAIGTMVLFPGTGVTIAGPIAAAFAGAGAGGMLGGLIGLAIGARIPREKVKPIDLNAPPEGILMSVVPHTEADKELIERELVAAGSDLVHR